MGWFDGGSSLADWAPGASSHKHHRSHSHDKHHRSSSHHRSSGGSVFGGGDHHKHNSSKASLFGGDSKRNRSSSSIFGSGDHKHNASRSSFFGGRHQHQISTSYTNGLRIRWRRKIILILQTQPSRRILEARILQASKASARPDILYEEEPYEGFHAGYHASYNWWSFDRASS
jgi:hypothetical protein